MVSQDEWYRRECADLTTGPLGQVAARKVDGITVLHFYTGFTRAYASLGIRVLHDLKHTKLREELQHVVIFFYAYDLGSRSCSCMGLRFKSLRVSEYPASSNPGTFQEQCLIQPVI